MATTSVSPVRCSVFLPSSQSGFLQSKPFLTSLGSLTILALRVLSTENLMGEVIEGPLKAEGLRFAIVASRWNDLIVSRLIDGAEDGLRRLGADQEKITVVRVPGSFEIPLGAKKCASSGKFDAIVCVGAVIRGETPHFGYLAAEVTSGIASVALETGVPISYGIITADTVEQAINRAGVKAGNKGFEAALAAVEMANLLRQL